MMILIIQQGYGWKQETKDRNRVWRETVLPETVVKDRNVDRLDRVRNGVNWKGEERDGMWWNVMERPGTWWKVQEWCRNDVGVSGMDLEKFYMTASGYQGKYKKTTTY